MYDYPNHADHTGHVSMIKIWDACRTRHSIARNEAIARDKLMKLLKILGSLLAEAFKGVELEGPDLASAVKAADALKWRL